MAKARQPEGSTLKVPPTGAKIQRLLDKENPDFNRSSPAATKRRDLMQENPARDIRDYLRHRK